MEDHVGISLIQYFKGTIPQPTHTLRWGEDIPPDVMDALRRGETAILLRSDGTPFSQVLMDTFGTIREKPIPEEKNEAATSLEWKFIEKSLYECLGSSEDAVPIIGRLVSRRNHEHIARDTLFRALQLATKEIEDLRRPCDNVAVSMEERSNIRHDT